MNGTIAQAVALVCHANGAIRGLPSLFWPTNSTTQFCEFVRFVRFERKLFGGHQEAAAANTPDEWFDTLIKQRTIAVRLQHGPGAADALPDRMSAGFVGGGGHWILEVLGADERVSRWIARWEVGKRGAPDHRIWRVTYGLVQRSRPERNVARPSFVDVRAELSAALTEIHAFSEQHGVNPFTALFARALDSMGGGPATGYHKDLAPEGVLGDDARTVLDACQSAWVFGAMGSWNDLGFEGDEQQRYERVSERLYQAVLAAIVAATNG
jgi:hypothetical protein